MRDTKYDIMELARTRWSPRAFSNVKIPLEEIRAVIEAATMAPSCFNEQPWRFVIFYEDDQVEKMKTFLSDNNKIWNKLVRSYILILRDNKFHYNGNDNKWAGFDTGAAWGMLSLEAERRGLITHAMAGFARKAIVQYLEIHDLTAIALVAIGKYGNLEDLEEPFRSKETPNTRKPIDEVILDKRFED
jgi:nitroreductase